MTETELLESRLNRLENIPDKFLSDVEKSEKKILAGIIEEIGRLQTEGGTFVKSDTNLALIANIREEIKRIIVSSYYRSAVTSFAREFDEQAIIQDNYFAKVFNTETSEFADSVLAGMKKRTVDALIGSPMDNSFIKPIENLLYDSVSTGAGFSDTVKSIREFAETTPDTDSKLLQYAKGIAHDAFAISDRTYSAVRSEEIGIEFFLDSGGVLDTTRPFCLERHGKYFHKKEIEMWGDGQKTEGMSWPDSNGDWAGKMPGTNKTTIFSFNGGFGCIHIYAPVSENRVPPDVIQRNIDNGNYEPSERVTELLEL